VQHDSINDLWERKTHQSDAAVPGVYPTTEQAAPASIESRNSKTPAAYIDVRIYNYG
jgi:hypothetical protein